MSEIDLKIQELIDMLLQLEGEEYIKLAEYLLNFRINQMEPSKILNELFAMVDRYSPRKD